MPEPRAASSQMRPETQSAPEAQSAPEPRGPVALELAHTLASLASQATVDARATLGAEYGPSAMVSGVSTLTPLDAPEAPQTRSVIPSGADRYHMVRPLGAGAMGEVILVEDRVIGREVAIKTLLPDRISARTEQRFLHEIKVVGALEHPNIVPIHDAGQGPDGRPYFVMKVVEGETLLSLIQKMALGDPETLAQYSFERRIELFLGLLQALSYAHSKGVLHRDLKPENIMVGPYGEVMLMDWGIALAAGEEQTLGIISGTPLYMSPEQARAEKIDERSDLYSAAAILHELLTLRHYLGEIEPSDGYAVLAEVGGAGWQNAYASWSALPRPTPAIELYYFLKRALSFDPKDRFQSATQMLDELHRILEGRIRVHCPKTFARRGFWELGKSVDSRPKTLMMATVTGTVVLGYGLIRIAIDLLG